MRSTFLAFALGLLAASHAQAGIIPVASGGDLQAALDRAQPGDIVALQPGATFTGNYTLGVKPGASYITVRSATPDDQLPAAGGRITPSLASRLARLQSPNADPVIRTDPGAHHWRLLALEFGPSADGAGDIIRLGDGSSAQRTLDQVPHDLVLDRCYVHGDPNTAQKRGVALNSASTSILGSWIADIKAPDQDSQAIAGWNGPGPFTIANNYLEAAGENIMFGGSDPSIDGLVPTGITIRANWVRKQTTWRDGRWQVKNLLELKNARAVVIEGNLFEYNWQAAQPGFAILFTPRNQDGHSPWSVVRDVTFRSNVVRHVAAAFNILGHDSPNSTGQTVGITIAENLVYDVDSRNWGGNGTLLQIGDAPADITFEHNTAFQTGNVVTVYGGSSSSPAQVTGFVFRNNLVLHNEYGIKGDNHGSGTSTIDAYFPGAAIVRNVIAGGPASQYPDGNLFPSVQDFYAQFIDASGENFQLAPSSAYMKAASDGNPIGVNPFIAHSVLAWATRNVAIAKPRKGSIGG